MIKRLFIFLMLAMLAAVFINLASHYEEKTSLSRLGQYYAENGPMELGAPNLVTAVVVTYRGLDTLGEVTVLFISAAAVSLLLRRARSSKHDQAIADISQVYKPASEIVETATQLLLPMVILFGVYVFINGHLSPGGGFQGGAIIASGTMFLLLALPESHLSRTLISVIESLSGFAYVVVGVLGVILAGGFLDNRILELGEYGSLISAGAIPLIYTFIGFKVGFELSAVLDRFRSEADSVVEKNCDGDDRAG
jgi:multicomponent Na+:H+ antiporter subunit B